MNCVLITTVGLFMLGASDPAELIEKHAATLGRIHSIHIKQQVVFQKGGSGEVRRISASEAWRSGTTERTVNRVFASFGPGGTLSDAPEYAIYSYGFTDRETRYVANWDPADSEPLDWAVSNTRFQRVQCSLGSRDPVAGSGSEWYGILLDVGVMVSLPRLAEQSEMQLVATDDPGIARLEVKGSKLEAFVGAVIDLDVDHGYMIKRLAPKDDFVSVAEDFTSFGDGIWIASRVRRSLEDELSITERLECEVNEPIAEDQLLVKFPVGARVEDPGKNQIHLWGATEPVASFRNDGELMQHLYAHSRELHGGRSERLVAGRSIWTSWMFWVNVILVVTLASLFVVRRRIDRTTA